ncbi:MAG: hypothetical protein AB1791_01025 [Chloroflexota bacterium]
MEAQMILEPTATEQQLLGVVRKLPPDRVYEVIDFAQFLEFKITKTQDLELLDEDGSEEEITADNARWDALLASDESQRLFEKMADEVMAEIQAGNVRPMIFTEDGEIAPG